MLVSVITPSYNSARFIKDTIKSVLSQTFKDWEMIIVDDNSSDDSVKVIKELIKNQNNIKLIELKTNVGAANARNIALKKAKGRYIAFLDSDDIWLKDKLKKQIDFMQKNGYAFSFCSYQTFSEDGLRDFKVIRVPKEIDYAGYCKNTIIGCLTVMIDRQKVGYFEMPDIRSSHDMALWLSILKKGYKAYGLDEVLAKYRVVSSSNTSKKLKAAKDVWRVYTDIENLSMIKSLWYFINYALNATIKRI